MYRYRSAKIRTILGRWLCKEVLHCCRSTATAQGNREPVKSPPYHGSVPAQWKCVAQRQATTTRILCGSNDISLRRLQQGRTTTHTLLRKYDTPRPDVILGMIHVSLHCPAHDRLKRNESTDRSEIGDLVGSDEFQSLALCRVYG